MSIIRKRRAERAKKAGISTVQSPEKEKAASQPGDDVPQVQVDDSQPPGTTKDDVQKIDGVPGAIDQADGEADLQPVSTTEQAITAVEAMPQDSEHSAGLAISIAPNADSAGQQTKEQEIPKPADQQPPTLDTSVTIPAKATDMPSETPQTGNFDEFESMFNDADFTTGDASISFEDMDFSTDNLNLDSTDNLNLDSLGGDAFPDISMTNTDIASVVPTSSEDINSLLPGLDNFVNAGADTAGTNTASAPPVPLPGISQATAASDAALIATTTQAPIEEGLGDSSFDDLFNSADLGVTNGTDMGTGTGEDLVLGDDFGEIEAFNEDWFKMD